MTYIVRSFLRHSEEDIFSEGCQPDTSTADCYIAEFIAASPAALYTKIKEHFAVDHPAIQLDTDDTVKGRIEVSMHENEHGMKASTAEFDLWKEGKYKLWLVTYTGNLEMLTEINWYPEGIER